MSFFNIYLSMTPQISVKNQKKAVKNEGVRSSGVRSFFTALFCCSRHWREPIMQYGNLLSKKWRKKQPKGSVKSQWAAGWPAFCVMAPLFYFRFKPVTIVREKKRTVSQANVLCTFIIVLLYQTIFFNILWKTHACQKQKRTCIFGRECPTGRDFMI